MNAAMEPKREAASPPCLPRPAAPVVPLAVFDPAEAIRRSMGRHDLFLQMVGFFDQERDALLERIRRGAVAGNAEEVADASHRLKGTVAYLGSRSASESLECVERIGRAGDLTRAGQAIQEMEKWIALLNDALASYRSKDPSQDLA